MVTQLFLMVAQVLFVVVPVFFVIVPVFFMSAPASLMVALASLLPANSAEGLHGTNPASCRVLRPCRCRDASRWPHGMRNRRRDNPRYRSSSDQPETV